MGVESLLVLLSALRSGIAGTLSEGIRAYELRHVRYIGLAKTHLQHLMTATVIDCKRVHEWLKRDDSHISVRQTHDPIDRLKNISPLVSKVDKNPKQTSFFSPELLLLETYR